MRPDPARNFRNVLKCLAKIRIVNLNSEILRFSHFTIAHHSKGPSNQKMPTSPACTPNYSSLEQIMLYELFIMYNITHLGTFNQNSKPKGANFDILHFRSFVQICNSVFMGFKPIEFHNSLHQTICLDIL